VSPPGPPRGRTHARGQHGLATWCMPPSDGPPTSTSARNSGSPHIRHFSSVITTPPFARSARRSRPRSFRAVSLLPCLSPFSFQGPSPLHHKDKNPYAVRRLSLFTALGLRFFPGAASGGCGGSRMSSTRHSSVCARATSIPTLGLLFPSSYREIVCGATPTAAASSACVMPLSARNFLSPFTRSPPLDKERIHSQFGNVKGYFEKTCRYGKNGIPDWAIAPIPALG